MPSRPYERFYPGEDKGLFDPNWGSGAWKRNAPSISSADWKFVAAAAAPGLLGLLPRTTGILEEVLEQSQRFEDREKKSNVIDFPFEQVWRSNDPEKDVVDLLMESFSPLEDYWKGGSESIERHFDALSSMGNYVETDKDRDGEKRRFKKYMDMVRPSMEAEGIDNKKRQLELGFKVYDRNRFPIDILWAQELESGDNLYNNLGISLEEWREKTFLKDMSEARRLFMSLRNKNKRLMVTDYSKYR
jgi:hypothetical protein